jgi:serine phosphatase RsbU (regulator of sigma subunit)
MISLFQIFKASPEEERLMQVTDNFSDYLNILMHSWLKTLTILGFTLVPIFFILDIFTIPDENRDLLPLFGLYRLVTTLIVITQFIIIIKTKPSKYSFLHGYIFNLSVSGAIVIMTVKLGGFNSSYYAGLNLVVIAVNLLLPWKSIHSALNGTFTIFCYILANVLFGGDFQHQNLINNLYFMSSTVIIAASINHVKFILIQKDFESRIELKQARDALWSEMEIAKQIQTALTPPNVIMGGYEMAATMIPAESVGGDYYDFIKTSKNPWVVIGDVSGHGVESGLIMMMTQTSVRTILSQDPHVSPSKLLSQLNTVIKENIALLKVDRYLTITAICFDENEITYAGSHQDLIIYRKETNKIETYPSFGTWIGMLDHVDDYMQNRKLSLSSGDMILLFTDGITELGFESKNMYGQERLEAAFLKNANLPLQEIVNNLIKDATSHHSKQEDDITVAVIRKV